MKIIIATIFLSLIAVGQERTIDFRTTDAKGLSRAEMKEYLRQREEFFSRLKKSSGLKSEIKSAVIQGNKIRTIIYNYGAISAPTAAATNLDLVWEGLGYGYEFGPLVGAKVQRHNATDSIKIVSEGFGTPADGEFGPDGLKWGWLPKAGYADPSQNKLATWGDRANVNNDLRIKPPSWPQSWYQPALGEYVFQSYLGGNSSVPDEEAYYAVDDFTKKEFAYYPDPNDTTKRGLGINLEVRTFQYANPLAEDIMFLVYTAENASVKNLPNVYFGMFGDPHVGGANNWGDDAASFIPAKEGKVFLNGVDLAYIGGIKTSIRSRNLVYAWDPDQKSDNVKITPGYFGYKFLESPNNSVDAIDNDDDGIVDESPFNFSNSNYGTYIDGTNVPLTTGITDLAKYRAAYGEPKPRFPGDENGDWDPDRDDVGVDGIAGTNDFGEGNGKPDQKISASGLWEGSEPNFGFRDVNESDQIGLKSFWALVFGGDNRPKNDILMYDKMSSDTSDVALLYPPEYGDNIFLYGSGPFHLDPGDRQRFSIALLLGLSLQDILLNSEVATRVLEANYRFAQPPAKPRLTVVPGDKRVTLYWDAESEKSFDISTGEFDFEGYKVYRSEDYLFRDVFTITDGNGNPYLGRAYLDPASGKSAQWHLPWNDSLKALYSGGYHPAEYEGRFVKYYMGDPNDVSGLQHQFVDSNVVNGKTYFYAVVAYDHGYYTPGLKIPPTETQAVIQRDPVTGEYKFDVNTGAAIPNGFASGILSPKNELNSGSTFVHKSGIATGKFSLSVVNEEKLANAQFRIFFERTKVGSDTVIAYSVERLTELRETILGNDTFFISTTNKNLIGLSIQVFDQNNAQISNTLLTIDSLRGRIKANEANILKKNQPYTIVYRYFPLYRSINKNGQDGNDVFDGMRLFAKDAPLGIDSLNSAFSPYRPANTKVKIAKSTVGIFYPAPVDLMVKFVCSTSDTTPAGGFTKFGDSLGNQQAVTAKRVQVPFTLSYAAPYDTIIPQAFVFEKSGQKSGIWDFNEEIIVLTPPSFITSGQTFGRSIFGITFSKNNPADKAVIDSNVTLTVKTTRPFTASDEYAFTSKSISYDKEKAARELDKVIVVPNPYVIYSSMEQPSIDTDLRGDRVIQFRNLPRECTIRIYTMTGELVQTLQKNNDENFVNWDVLSSESARVAYGIYIYHVSTPHGGEKIGRLGIIK